MNDIKSVSNIGKNKPEQPYNKNNTFIRDGSLSF